MPSWWAEAVAQFHSPDGLTDAGQDILSGLNCFPDWLWRHENHRPGIDFAYLGVAALVGDHPGPRDQFQNLLRAYLQSPIPSAIEERRYSIQGALERDESLRVKVRAQYRLLRHASQDCIRQSPWKANDLLVQSLPNSWQSYLTARLPDAPEYDGLVGDFINRPSLGSHDNARNAVKQLVTAVSHPHLTRQLCVLFNDNLVFRALSYRDNNKPSSKQDRATAIAIRRVLKNGADTLDPQDPNPRYEKTHMDITALAVARWAVIWERHEGRPMLAIKREDELLRGNHGRFMRSSAISAEGRPLNTVFGVKYKVGPVTDPQIGLLRDWEESPDYINVERNQSANRGLKAFR